MEKSYYIPDVTPGANGSSITHARRYIYFCTTSHIAIPYVERDVDDARGIATLYNEKR